MKSDEIFDLEDALYALYEKCHKGYRLAIKYDPLDKSSWITWSSPKSAPGAEAGRGVAGSVFEADALIQMVRQFILDCDRLEKLHEFRKRHG